MADSGFPVDRRANLVSGTNFRCAYISKKIVCQNERIGTRGGHQLHPNGFANVSDLKTWDILSTERETVIQPMKSRDVMVTGGVLCGAVGNKIHIMVEWIMKSMLWWGGVGHEIHIMIGWRRVGMKSTSWWSGSWNLHHGGVGHEIYIMVVCNKVGGLEIHVMVGWLGCGGDWWVWLWNLHHVGVGWGGVMKCTSWWGGVG